MPAFYRNVAGNIPDVTAFELTVEDAGIAGVTIIADAGFASGANFDMLVDSDLSYIVPLKRNTREVTLDNVAYEGIFTYHHRAVSFHDEARDGYRICLFRDEKLRADEMADFVGRQEKSNAASKRKKAFDPKRDLRDIPKETAEKASSFGTMTLRTSLMDTPAQSVYEMYKLRWEIEQLFDTMRNTLDSDTSNMQDDEGFEAWSFVNHVMLIVACRVLAMVRAKKLSKEYSLAGVMDILSRINMVRVGGEWQMAETTKKTKKMLGELGIGLDPDDIPVPL
jgi:transposase